MRWLSLLLMLLPALALATPVQITHQGRLLDPAGGPIQGERVVVFTLYDAFEGGSTLFAQGATLSVADGYYSVTLGSDEVGNPLQHSVFQGSARYLGVTVDGAELRPRTAIVSVPYAVHAGTSTAVEGGVVNATEIRVNDQVVIDGDGSILGTLVGDEDTLRDLGCSAGEIVRRGDGDWLCVALEGSHTHAASEVGLGPLANSNPLNHARYTDAEARTAMGPKSNANPYHHDRPTQLACTTVSGEGNAGSCWGASYIYCPSGTIMTGGGIQQSNQSLEQSRPCSNAEGQCFVCDNTAGCGTGTCFVRCCSL